MLSFFLGMTIGAALAGAIFLIANFEKPDALDAAEKDIREDLTPVYKAAKEKVKAKARGKP